MRGCMGDEFGHNWVVWIIEGLKIDFEYNISFVAPEEA